MPTVRPAPGGDDLVAQAVAGARAGADTAVALVEAVDRALAQGDVHHAVALVEAHVRQLLEPAPVATLAGLVAQLPTDLVRASPRLRDAMSWAEPARATGLRATDGRAPGLPGTDVADTGGRPLSTREREILGLLATGMTNKEIAGSLYLGVNTVKWYLKALYARFGVASRLECVHEARARGLLP